MYLCSTVLYNSINLNCFCFGEGNISDFFISIIFCTVLYSWHWSTIYVTVLYSTVQYFISAVQFYEFALFLFRRRKH